jgi:hypothetical protein
MDALTAFHESGHATVSLLYGELPEHVTIRPDDDSGGHTALLGVEARAIAGGGSSSWTGDTEAWLTAVPPASRSRMSRSWTHQAARMWSGSSERAALRRSATWRSPRGYRFGAERQPTPDRL